MKLASTYPNFCDLIEKVCNEFRTIKENTGKDGAYSHVKVAIINYWGRMYSWMINGTFTDDHKPQTEGYTALINAICGQPVDVSFVSFDEIMKANDLNKQYDVLINTGLEGSAFQGDYYWKNSVLLEKIREFVANGGGFVGIGNPTGYKFEGKYFQLSDVLGVEKEIGFTYAKTKFFPTKNSKHWILKDVDINNVKFSKNGIGVYPLSSDVILASDSEFNPTTCLLTGGDVYLSANEYGKGRAIYLAPMHDSADAYRLIYKILLWCSHSEDLYQRALSVDVNTDCYYYKKLDSYAILNSSNKDIDTLFYDINGNKKNIHVKANDILWL